MLHEIPGLHPGVVDFARRLIAAGYTVCLHTITNDVIEAAQSTLVIGVT